MTPVELRHYADTIRGMIQYECTLEVQRLGWLMVSQSLLFTAAGSLLHKDGNRNIRWLVYFICTGGLISTALTACLLSWGGIARHELLKQFGATITQEAIAGNNYEGPPVVSIVDIIQRGHHWQIWLVESILPGALWLMWAWLLMAALKGKLEDKKKVIIEKGN